jgi:AraC-like DNA-binding protein
MIKIANINNIEEVNANNNHTTLHPLITVVDFSKANPRDWGNAQSVKFQYGLYSVFLKDVKCGDLRYGRHLYDYQAGTLIFFAPNQVAEMDNVGVYQPMGYGLFFDAELINGTSLAQKMRNYHFFDYQTNEALHISEVERQIVLDCFSKIAQELKQPIDKHSRKLIIANIELFLSYCERFYDRQFVMRDDVHKGIIEKFENLLNRYFLSDKLLHLGLPSVAYFAAELHLSPNYFGDVIKKQIGQSAKEYIQKKVIDVAKTKLTEEKTVNEIAYEMGFKYPQHFTRLFKQRVGLTPNEYRQK